MTNKAPKFNDIEGRFNKEVSMSNMSTNNNHVMTEMQCKKS